MVTQQGLVGLDSNVLLAAFSPGDHPHREPARALLHSLTPEQPGFITQVSLSELFFTLRRSYKVPNTEVLALIETLIKTPSVEFEDGESVIYALDRAHAGADFPDALIAVTHELFGTTETVTFDRGAAKKLGWSLLS